MRVSELLVCIGSWFHRQQGRPGYASACVAAVDSMKMRRMVPRPYQIWVSLEWEARVSVYFLAVNVDLLL